MSVIAENLATRARHRLVRDLHAAGLTDVEIAERTLMTTYTTTRIREALGLPAVARGGRTCPTSGSPTPHPSTPSCGPRESPPQASGPWPAPTA